jgi:hypothetical protein
LSASDKTADKSVSANSRSVLVGLLVLVGLILLVYTISVSIYTSEQVGRLNSVFIALITGILALGGTLITQLWGGGSSTTSDRPFFYVTSPIDSAVEVPLNTKVMASSNVQLDQTTINSNTFTLKDNKLNKNVEGTVTLEGGNVIFQPKDSLKPDTKYTATITKEVKDIAGRLLGTDKVWSFTTIKQQQE